jgi:hypothetical protein
MNGITRGSGIGLLILGWSDLGGSNATEGLVAFSATTIAGLREVDL